jgi:hypothetical protein
LQKSWLWHNNVIRIENKFFSMSSNTTNDATSNTPGVTFGTPSGTPSGAGGGGNPFNWGRLSPPQSSPPTIQLVTTNPAKILKEKFTHDEIVEVYESFKAMRYSDATVDLSNSSTLKFMTS